LRKIDKGWNPGRVTAPTPERDRLVAAAAKRWQEALVDDSGRNQLAYYRDLKAGTLNLADARVGALAQLLAGTQVTLKQLFPESEPRNDALRRVRAIRKQMRIWQEERGVDVGYLASGLATWDEIARTPRAPVMLQQLTIRPSSLAETDYVLKCDPEPALNPVLLRKLEKDHGLVLPLEELADIVGNGDTEELFTRLRKLCHEVPGFLVQPGQLVGTFTYAKLPMVDDIGEHLETLAQHDVIAALAGDNSALRLLNSGTEIDVDIPDHIPPTNEHLVLDADSTQSHAINAVLAGQHLVIKGPPGTGKSQTIANLIAALAARGRTALFVAEKRAAIDAVLDRLEQVGLDDLVHNLHGEQQSRRELARSLELRLHRARAEGKPNVEEADRRLQAMREPMIAHHKSLHQLHEPWGVSAYTIQAFLMGMPKEAQNAVRWTGAELRSLHGQFVEQVGSAVVELARLPVTGPWAATTLNERDHAQDAYELASEAAAAWKRSKLAVARLTADLGLEPVGSPDQARLAVQLATDVDFTLSRLAPDCYTVELIPWQGFWQKFKAAKQMRELWIDRKKPPRAVLKKAHQAVREQKERWIQVSVDGMPPRVSEHLPAAQEALAGALELLSDLYDVVPIDDIDIHVQTLAEDQLGLLNGLRRNELREFLEPFHIDPLLDGPPELADQRFTFAWLQSILDHLRFTDDHLGRFQGERLHVQSAQFRQADMDHLVAAAARVRYSAARNLIEVLDAYPEQQRLVRSEAAKKMRHLPVRRLFEQAPEALMALKPCWAMSPLLASQVLPARTLFDVVIFDEASQVEPVDAITAIMRGRQVVVAGDEHQLPPTAFFQRVPDEDPDFDEELEHVLTEDIESLLQSFANVLPLQQVKHLAWHYRSRDERLIAFSNAHIYAPSGNPLVTFPGADTSDCLRHVLVPSTASEADVVVKQILEHAKQRPQESLGVITMGLKHAEAVETALRVALGRRSELSDFFDEKKQEPFFVKSIERVQGDERDAIILSVGYSRNHDGRMLYRWGPLNNKGGERRLNVAVTRAKHRTTLVSSFRHADLDGHRLKAQGAKLLAAYLEYAATGGSSLAGRQHGGPLTPFESDIRDRLVSAGIPLVAHYGVSGRRIEFAAHDPDNPERMLLAIETDGVAYHAAPTARDRERLRQQHLERLGWRYHRIWTADWYLDPKRQIEFVKNSFHQALIDGPSLNVNIAPVRESKKVIARGPRPALPEYDEIGDIPYEALADLVAWIESDGLNRTEDELVAETVEELGFQRRGNKIVEAVLRARRLNALEGQ
jgi:hypothetical protein